jgi:hypothetical protein
MKVIFFVDISDVHICNKDYELAKCVLWHYFQIVGVILKFTQKRLVGCRSKGSHWGAFYECCNYSDISSKNILLNSNLCT